MWVPENRGQGLSRDKGYNRMLCLCSYFLSLTVLDYRGRLLCAKIHPSENPIVDVLSTKLMALLGPKGWIGPEDCQPWQRDWLDQYGEIPLGLARPKSTAEVSDVLRLCYGEGVPVVP